LSSASPGYKMFSGGSWVQSNGNRYQLNQYCFLDLFYVGDASPSAPLNFARGAYISSTSSNSIQGCAIRFTPNDTFIANCVGSIAVPTTPTNLMRYSLCKGNAVSNPFTLDDKDVIWQRIIQPSQYYSEQEIYNGWLMLNENVTLEAGQEYTMIADTMFATTTVNSIIRSTVSEASTAIMYPSSNSNLLAPASNLHYTISSSTNNFSEQTVTRAAIIFGYKDEDQIFGT